MCLGLRLEVREEVGAPKSNFTSLSLIRLNRDFTGVGRAGGLCASGSVLPSLSGSGRQHSQPAVRSDQCFTDCTTATAMRDVTALKI